MRIVAAVGIEYRFTLDTELLLTPNLNIDNNQLLFKYLRDMSTDHQFVISILKIIIEERRTAHHKIWNKGKQNFFSK